MTTEFTDAQKAEAKSNLIEAARAYNDKVAAQKASKTNGKTNELSALDLARQDCEELFLDQYGQHYAVIVIDGHTEAIPILSSRFRSWVNQLYYQQTRMPLSGEDTKTVIEHMKAQAEFSKNRKNLSLRVAGSLDRDAIHYDLTNDSWECIRITKDGWRKEQGPIVFNRYSTHRPQVDPDRNYTVDILDNFLTLLNIDNPDDKLLLKCYIVALLIPDIPKPILALQGEQGSAKSTLQELVKSLVDPGVPKTLTFPRSKAEIVQQLSHNYVAYFDNVTLIPDYTSDELCKAVTGSGFSKRVLYSNDEDVIYEFKRCIGFNGINLGSTKADLLDRSLIFQLKRVPKEKRRKIVDIWAEFERIRPQLLGYIMDILVQVLQKQGTVKLPDYPRMADFAEYGELIARAMGYPEYRFFNAYRKNQELQVEAALEANPVSSAVIKLMEDREEWTGNSTQLLTDLDLKAMELKINTVQKGWPKAPNSLSRRVNEVITNLREIGITIERAAGKLIVIRKISKISNIEENSENPAQTKL